MNPTLVGLPRQLIPVVLCAEIVILQIGGIEERRGFARTPASLGEFSVNVREEDQ